MKDMSAQELVERLQARAEEWIHILRRLQELEASELQRADVLVAEGSR